MALRRGTFPRMAPLIARFLESTRGRIVNLLRRSSRTVDELADELGITDNAVRLHLGTLERDGIVRAAGVRREGSVGKPATVYEVHPSTDTSFSSAYVPFLSALLATLSDKLSTRDLRALMRDVGRRLSGGTTAKPDGSLAARAESASRALNELGGMTVVERADGVTVIDDSYNASPESMRAAMRALMDVADGGRTIAVVGEMLEMGEASRDAHWDVGHNAVRLGIDYLLVVGEGAKPAFDAAVREGSWGDEAAFVGSIGEARAYLSQRLTAGDTVLVKGSHGSGLYELADALVREDA